MNELDKMAYLGLNFFWIPLMVFLIVVFVYHMHTGKNLFREILKIFIEKENQEAKEKIFTPKQFFLLLIFGTIYFISVSIIIFKNR